MADGASDAKTTPAMLYAVILELSKHMAAQAHKTDLVIAELRAVREIWEVNDPGPSASAPASASSSPSSTTPAPASAAPSSPMEGLLEEMIAEEMGIDPAALRAGNLDREVMRKLIREAKAKKQAAASNNVAT